MFSIFFKFYTSLIFIGISSKEGLHGLVYGIFRLVLSLIIMIDRPYKYLIFDLIRVF